MRAALLLAAVVLYGGCTATPTEMPNPEKSPQNEESQSTSVTSNSAQATATATSTTKTSSKSSAKAWAGNSGQSEKQGSSEHELKNSKHKSTGNGGDGGQASGSFGGRGQMDFGDQESEGDYLGKNFPYGEFEDVYEEQDDGFANPEDSGGYNDIDISSQVNARGEIEGLSAALLLAHHANLARLLHLSHHLYTPEIIGLHFLTRGVPGGGLVNVWPLHHLTNHKLKELIAISNALSKPLPNLLRASPLGHGKLLNLQSLVGLQTSGMSSNGQDARRIQNKQLH